MPGNCTDLLGHNCAGELQGFWLGLFGVFLDSHQPCCWEQLFLCLYAFSLWQLSCKGKASWREPQPLSLCWHHRSHIHPLLGSVWGLLAWPTSLWGFLGEAQITGTLRSLQMTAKPAHCPSRSTGARFIITGPGRHTFTHVVGVRICPLESLVPS